jgi:hypothetical protein
MFGKVFEQMNVEMNSICAILISHLLFVGALLCRTRIYTRRYIHEHSNPRNKSIPNPNINRNKRGYQCVESNNKTRKLQ